MLSVSQSAMSSSELFSQLICLCFKRDCGIQHPPARIIGSTSCTMDINGHAPYANAQHVQVCTCTSWTCIGSCMLTCVVGADRHKKQARLVVDAQCIKELAYLPHAGSIKLADCCGAYLDPTAPLTHPPGLVTGAYIEARTWRCGSNRLHTFHVRTHLRKFDGRLP